MHSHCVLRLVADAFDDIDFAVIGPAWARHPKGRPDTAGIARHVFEVEDHEAVGVLLAARDTDAVTAATSGSFGGVGLDCYDAVVDSDQTLGLGGILVNIVDVAMGWVIFLSRVLVLYSTALLGQTHCVKGEKVHEVVTRVIILNGVSSTGKGNQSTAKQQSRKMHIDSKE